MRVVIVLVFSVFLLSCSDNGPGYYANNTDSTFRLQPLAVDTTYHTVSVLDSSVQDLKQESIQTGFVALDKAIDDMSSDASVHKERTEGYCWGDCCGASLEFKDKVNGNRLFLIKSNCGDAGYSNHQYYFEHNDLKIVRDFECTNEEIGTTLTEKVYFLENNIAYCKQRKVMYRHDSLSFYKQHFKTKELQLLSVNKSKMRDLQDLLAMQKPQEGLQ